MTEIKLEKEPVMPDGHLFEFCPRDYWESLNTLQLLRWVNGISWHLDERETAAARFELDEAENEGLAARLGIILEEAQIDFTGSGRVGENFHGKNFATTDFYKFLCWAGQRLLWLDRTSIAGEEQS